MEKYFVAIAFVLIGGKFHLMRNFKHSQNI